ncbi:hypothetical protein WDW89_13445 [Deltaproteobacteria bacterium TL4]
MRKGIRQRAKDLARIGLMGVCCLVLTTQNRYGNELLQYAPIPEDLKEVTTFTDRSVDLILKWSNLEYWNLTKNSKLKFPTEELEKYHRFTVSYNRISSLRYRRSVLKLPKQKGIAELSDYLMKSIWFKRYVIPVTTQPLYGYSPEQALRITITSHTASHFFQIPYPTMLCLLFQESKFDFNVRSYTGALGLGQLTSIGVEQFQKLREDPQHEKRLQAAAQHLRHIYNDPVLRKILKQLGLTEKLIDLGDFPTEVEQLQPDINSFIKEVGEEVVLDGKAYGLNEKLMRALVQRILRGDVLSGKYAAIHPAVYKVADRRYGKTYGSVLNIETNVLITAMLLRYYILYPWRIEDEWIHFHPPVQTIIAVAAYNQGQGPVIKWLSQLKKEYPDFDLSKGTLIDYQPFFTTESLKKVLYNSTARSREAFEHVWKITECSEDLALYQLKAKP